MAWFKRTDKGIQTPTEAKRDTPKGLWYKSPTAKIIETEELERNFFVSPEDGYHVRIGSNEYFNLLFDDNKFKELDKKVTSKDPLKFTDKKKYIDRLKAAQEKTKLNDAVRTAVGKSKGKDLVVACMDFSFIGGSMGSVVGEKNCSCCRLLAKEKASIHDHFKIRGSTNDGSRVIVDATGENLSKTSTIGRCRYSLHFIVYRSHNRRYNSIFCNAR